MVVWYLNKYKGLVKEKDNYAGKLAVLFCPDLSNKEA